MMRRQSFKSWLARKFDARYVKRSEFNEAISRLEKAVKASQADANSAMRMAREGGLGVESLLAKELEMRQEIDAITGEGS